MMISSLYLPSAEILGVLRYAKSQCVSKTKMVNYNQRSRVRDLLGIT
jgi:hypothetical protein